MRNNKKKILICAIGAFLLASFVAVLIRDYHKNSLEEYPDYKVTDDVDDKDFLMEEVSDTIEEEEYTQKLGEEREKIREDFLTHRKEDILDNEGNVVEQGHNESTTLEVNPNVTSVPFESDEVIPENADLEEDGEEFVLTPMQTQGYEEYEVVCDAVDWEDAELIAEQISGSVISVENGVATIQISVHVDELLSQLEEQGSTLKIYRKYNFVIK